MNVNNSRQANETVAPPWSIPFHTLITLYSILLVLSLVGNVLVIAVVYCSQNLRTNMNYLIVNMAVSDLLVPLVAMPLNISWNMANGEWLVDGPLGEALCKLVYFFSELSPFVSSINLVTIAFQRFMAVVYPLRGQILIRKLRWIAISFPWIVAMVLHTPYFYVLRLTNIHGNTECYASWSPAFDDEIASTLIFTSILTVLGFVIPLFVIITLYAMIIQKLRRSLNNVSDMMEKETLRSRQKTNRRIFSMLITIVVLFTICWCPLLGIVLLRLVAPASSLPNNIYTLFIVFSYMWYLLAAINPCIYFLFLRDFRQGLKSLCCRKCASVIEPIPRRPRTPHGDGNQDPTCTPPHFITTSL